MDAITLFDVRDLRRYWAKHPPVHVLVGAFLGAGRRAPEPAGPDPATEEQVEAFVRMFHQH